jgi:splicing factor U2AF subunit
MNLRIRWTEDYEKLGPIKPRRPVPTIDTAALGIISTKVEEGPLKIFIGGIPKELSEE